VWFAALAWWAGCAAPQPDQGLSRAELLNPESCTECHPRHVREWSGSAHARASTSPVFRAMAARGLRETEGALGSFCVDCHAPMAVREGATADGSNLDAVDPALQGVTCIFCHTADSIEGTDNAAAVHLANDGVLRGGLAAPHPSKAHASAFAPLQDRTEVASSDLCGACHDLRSPAGLHLERTYSEWQGSGFSSQERGQQMTCGSCHMEGRDDVAADVRGVLPRRVHSHTMVGVDVAMPADEHTDVQVAEIQRALDTTLGAALDVCSLGRGSQVVVTLENIAAGHSWPSGTPHRVAWVEVVATLDGETVLSTGAVADDEPLPEDPDLWRIGDRMVDEEGAEVHYSWEAADWSTNALLAPASFGTAAGHAETHLSRVWELDLMPDTVTLRVRYRPLSLVVLEDLVASGDLDPSLVPDMPTYALGAASRTWTLEADGDCWLR
jgi:hypothetical protein